MCNEDGRESTNPGMDHLQIILDELQSIKSNLKDFEERINDRIEKVEKKIEHMEGRVEQVVTDLNTVHSLQRTYTGRLAVIEQMCVDAPLVTAIPTPPPSKPPPGDGAGGDGRLKP